MKNKKDILILIDGNALMHRSFHGMPPLKTKDNILVNAVYGFTTSILSAIKYFNPRYLAVTFDVSKKTFRNKIFNGYKANRAKTDDLLIKQFPLAYEVCKAMNFPILSLKNYEADDVIGTICKKVKDKVSTIIVTGDMDTLQLIDENVQVYSLARGIKKAQLFDIEKVYEKYNFYPDQIIDYKALRGDPTDNIPGVPKIGQVTAKKLINQFHDLDNIYNNIDRINAKINQNLTNNKKIAYLSKELATINTSAPIDFNIKDAEISDYDQNKAIALFKKLEFKSLINKMPHKIEKKTQQKLF